MDGWWLDRTVPVNGRIRRLQGLGEDRDQESGQRRQTHDIAALGIGFGQHGLGELWQAAQAVIQIPASQLPDDRRLGGDRRLGMGCAGQKGESAQGLTRPQDFGLQMRMRGIDQTDLAAFDDEQARSGLALDEELLALSMDLAQQSGGDQIQLAIR